jgi:hypothetical protein
MNDDGSPRGRHLAALCGVSAAALAFEVLLLRLFELSHWHSFAGLAIGLALLGLGAAGTTLTLLGERIAHFDERWLAVSLIATGVGLQGVIVVHAQIALRPIFATWDAIELARLLLVDLSAFVPFYAAGLAIGRSLARWPHHTRVLYAFNLLGSAFGCVVATALLAAMQVQTALALVALAVAVLSVLNAVVAKLSREARIGVVAATSATVLLVAAAEPAVSDFKALARVRDLPDARVVAAMPGLRGPLTVVHSDALRFAPGLSLAWPDPVPPADVAIVGSDREVPIARDSNATPAHARASLAGLPFALRPAGGVLVVGSSAWQSPALAGPSRRVIWIEPDLRLTALARMRGAASLPVPDHPYRYLQATPERYALILADQAHDAGDASSEDFLLTVEGVALALQRLEPEGLIAIPLRVTQPPRHLTRVLATLADGLRRAGIADAAAHVVALRGLQTHLLLVSRSPFGGADIGRIERFARQWQFDFDWRPDARSGVPVQYHRLDQPVFQQIARALLVQDTALPDDATWFATQAATLDQPYVWRSLRWDRAAAIVESLGRQAMTFFDWSLIFGAVTLGVTTLLGFALILAPLGRLPAIGPPFSRTGIAVYFALLGLGYLLIEIAILQRATLFVGEPILAASVVIATFLAGSGIGSLMAPRTGTLAVVRVFGAIGAAMTVVAASLWLATPALLQCPLALRIAIVAATLLPLAWSLGRPFPWALSQLADRPHWVPWVWGINGFASVASASLAPLINVHHGQLTTLGAGLACYAMAAGVASRWTARRGFG